MRVAIFTVGELFGGVERHVLGLIEGLPQTGVHVELVLFSEGELARAARDRGLRPVVFQGSNFRFFSTGREIARWMKAERIDVIHAHGYKSVVFAAMATRFCNRAIVKTEHGLPEWLAGMPIQSLREYVYRFVDLIATRIAVSAVCYVTHELKTRFDDLHHALPQFVIPNGIAEIRREHFARPTELATDRYHLAIVGRLDRVKGHAYAIQAVSSLERDLNVHLVFIGVGPCESELRGLAKGCGISDRVHFLGFQRNVYAYLASSDTVLIPSIHEGLPYVLLESLALGIPVIASDVGGLAEVLENDRTAIVVPPGNVAALAAAIRRLRLDPEHSRELSRRGRDLWERSFSLGAMVQKYRDVYGDAIQGAHVV